MEPVGSKVEEVAAEIVDYLRQRPDAADTAEGVVRWWVKPVSDEFGIDVVYVALVLLMERGLVERVYVGDRVLHRATQALFD